MTIGPLRVRTVTRLVLGSCPLVSAAAIQATPATPDVTVSFEVATLDDGVVLRLYRSDHGDLSLVAEVSVDAGTSVMRFKDRPPASESTTYELHWITKGGEEYFLGRAYYSASVESSDEVLSTSSGPEALCASDGIRVLVAEHRKEETDSKNPSHSTVDPPKPPP